MNYKQIYDEKESMEILTFLNTKEFEYHKPYIRYAKPAKVPRGQASYTFDESIHYDYKVAGGSPPNEIMCDKLKKITLDVNKVLNTNYNTILMNVYKDGKDCIGGHHDKETGWREETGFATLAFGSVRNFDIRSDETDVLTRIPHKNGWVIEMPYPMNSTHTHAVPSQPRIKEPRISLTFREIIPNQNN